MKKGLIFASGVLTGIGLTAVGEWMIVNHKVKNLVSDVEDITEELLSDDDSEEVVSSDEDSIQKEKSEGGVSDEKEEPSGDNS